MVARRASSDVASPRSRPGGAPVRGPSAGEADLPPDAAASPSSPATERRTAEADAGPRPQSPPESAGGPPEARPAAEAAAGAAAPGAPPSHAAAGNDALRVYLMTMGPGDAVWEKFGHNALWVHDPATGMDVAYNYGMFDFRQENFILRFVQGRMLYWMQGFDAGATVEHYRGYNRDVWVQELNLTGTQKAALRDFLRANELPENRFYRYDYYYDNCSTRVRDAIDRVLGGRLKALTAGTATGTTYRSHTRRLTAGDALTYTGLEIGLGSPSDRPISAWEEMFLPLSLRERVRDATVAGPDGRAVPLVLSERHVVRSVGRETEREEPPSWIPIYLAVGAAVAALLAFLGTRAPRSRAARHGFAALSGLWLLLVGTGGVVLAGLWALTDHQIAYRNENLFQLDPLALPLVVLLPALAYGRRWAARPAAALAVAVAALSLLGLVLQVLPGLDQVNGEVIALFLPAHLALAWTALRLRGAARAQALPRGRTAAGAD